jgi:hypothetical protein
MSPQGIVALARQGHPIAIGTLINYSTKSLGIKVRVQRREACLFILLEAEHLPDQSTAVAFIQKSLKILNVQPIKTVMVYGRHQGNKQPSWQQRLDLNSPGSTQLDVHPAAVHTSSISHSFGSSFIRSSSMMSASLSNLEPMPTHDLDLIERSPSESSPFTETPPPLNPSDPAPEVLRRPESVILIIFVSLLVFWDAYISFLDELKTETSLTSGQLAQRLGTSRRTVRRKKNQDGFDLWTQRLDPDGIAWVYRKGVYVPQV